MLVLVSIVSLKYLTTVLANGTNQVFNNSVSVIILNIERELTRGRTSIWN